MTTRILDRAVQCELFAGDDAGAALRRVKLSPWGRVKSKNKGFVVDAEAAAAIVAEFEAHGVAVPIDVEHELVYRENFSPKDKIGAVGWIEALSVEPGVGLFGNVRWNDEGRKRIREDRYRYLSPVFIVDAETRRALSLHSAAITNKPALSGMEKLAASERTETDTMDAKLKALLDEIAVLLAIDLDDDPAKMLEGIKRAVKEKKSDDAEAVASSVRSVLGLKADAGKEETLTAMGRVCHAAMTEKTKLLALNALVEPYVRKGLLQPDSKWSVDRERYEEMLALAASSPDAFHTVMRERAASAPPWGRTTPPAPSGKNKSDRTTIIANAVREFQTDPGHARITTCEKFVNLALYDAGEKTLHSDELALIPEAKRETREFAGAR